MRFIKIQTPSNELISIDLSTNEFEFRDLLSYLSGIDNSKIKGLRDKYGNYFTLSSALNNPQLNFNYSSTYFLVCDNILSNHDSYIKNASINNNLDLINPEALNNNFSEAFNNFQEIDHSDLINNKTNNPPTSPTRHCQPQEI